MWPRLSAVQVAVAACVAIALSACGKPAEDPASKARDAAYKEKYAKAEALFKERCKTAGIVIKRTVKDVEGIELTKVRKLIPWGGKEYFDPMYPEAAMAGENRGDDYIKQFLMSEFISAERPEERGFLGPRTSPRSFPHLRKDGYSFVEYRNDSGQLLHCVPTWRPVEHNWVAGQHRCDPVAQGQARYALDYEDLVDPADRQLWVAGTRLKVIDKQTGELIAQLTKFIWDPGFGSSSTERWPWEHADGNGPDRNCPYTPFKPTHNDSRYFIDAVVIPKQGD